MLHEQQRIYTSHISELRGQLQDLEDATKSKYEEQISSLQLEVKMKGEQVQRAVAERERTEAKLRQRLEEVGHSS